jgi:hypothetical protein
MELNQILSPATDFHGEIGDNRSPDNLPIQSQSGYHFASKQRGTLE